MVSKTSLGLIGVGLLVLVTASKQIGSFFGQVGSSVGTSLSMGLQDFVSALNPLAGMQQQQSGSVGTVPAPMQMMQAMTTPSPTENPAQALTGGVITTGAMAAINAGAADSTLKTITDTIAPNVETGAIPINTNTLQSFFDMLTTMFPNVTEQIPTIADTLNSYLQAGGKSISDFASNFKFPSGQTLDEILGQASKIGEVPDAAAMLGGSPATPSNLVTIMTMIAPLMMQPKTSVMYAAGNEPIPLSELLNMTPAKMLSMMNLNIDMKIDTPYAGVIETGSNPNSIGAGAGTILKPQTLTQVLQQNPNLNASEAADVLAMINNTLPSGFNFGTNTGGGSIEMFNPMMKVIPNSVMESPALLAYENYKALYGLM